VDQVGRPISLDEQDEYRDQTKHPTIARLGRFSTQLPGGTDAGLGPQPSRPKLHHASADQPEDAAEVEMLRSLSFAQQGLLQVRERSRVLLVRALAGLVSALAGFVLPARRVLVRVAIALVGSAWWLGALVAGGIVAIPSTSRPGWWRVAGRRTRGQGRPTPGPRRGDRCAGLGVLCDQAESGPDEGPHQRARDHQELAATAK
jgi:hypothetical protein